MATYSGWKAERFSGAATNRDFTLGATPNAGDEIFVIVWRSNGATTGAQNHATATGFTEPAGGHYDPPSTFRMIGTVLQKTAVGGEGTINFDWTATDGETHQVFESVIVSGIDASSVTVSFDHVNGTVWNFPGDTLDNSIHIGAAQKNTDISTSMYPTGDSDITHSVVDWRNGGLSLSGGNTASQTHSETVNGSFGTLSFNDSGGPTATLTDYTNGQIVEPGLAPANINLSLAGPEDITTAVLEIQRDSDSLYWDFISAWVAGPVSQQQAVTGTTPQTFAFPTTGLVFDESVTYTVRSRAADPVNSFGAWASQTIVGGTYQYTPDITFTAANVAGPPSVTLDPPESPGNVVDFIASRNSYRGRNGDITALDIGGSADSNSGNITSVETRLDGGTWVPATIDTGAGTPNVTFSHSYTATNGASHTIEVRATNGQGTSTPVSQVYELNAKTTHDIGFPTVSGVDPGPLAITINNGVDDADTVVAARGNMNLVVRLTDDTDGTWWNDTTQLWEGSAAINQMFEVGVYTFTGTKTPTAALYELENEPLPGVTLILGHTYTLTTWLRDVDFHWGVFDSVTFASTTLEESPTISFTNLSTTNGGPTVSNEPVSFLTGPGKYPAGPIEIVATGIDLDSDVVTTTTQTRRYRVEAPNPTARVREAKLGNGGNIQVFVVGRYGGNAPGATVAELPVSSATGFFERRLDQTSSASIQVTLSALDMERCCDDLGSIETYAHELHIWWDGLLAWVGPVTYLRHRKNGIVLRADDLTVHWETRTLGEHIHQGVELATIFADYHRDAYQQDQWGMEVIVKPTGITGTREVLASEGMVASRGIDELSRTGIDWTAIGRDLVVGGEEVLTRPIATLTDSHFTNDLEPVEDGTNRATDVVVSGDGVSGRASEPETSDIRRRYGLITARSQELNIVDSASAQQAAVTRLDYFREPQRIDTGAGKLTPDAPVAMIDLVPGSRIRVVSTATCRKVAQTFRLSKVIANMDGTVSVGFQPLGSTVTGSE